MYKYKYHTSFRLVVAKLKYLFCSKQNKTKAAAKRHGAARRGAVRNRYGHRATSSFVSPRGRGVNERRGEATATLLKVAIERVDSRHYEYEFEFEFE